MDRLLARRALGAAVIVGIVAQALVVDLAVGVNLVVLTAAILACRRACPPGRVANRPSRCVDSDRRSRGRGRHLRCGPTTCSASSTRSLLRPSSEHRSRRSPAPPSRGDRSGRSWPSGRSSSPGRSSGSCGSPRSPDGPRRTHRAGPSPAPTRAVIRGLALALPVLLIFGLLFASADAIFASFAETLFDWQVDLGELPIRASVAFAVAWVVAGLLSVATGVADEAGPGVASAMQAPRSAPPPMQSLGAAVATVPESRPATPRLGVVESLTILVAVDVLFAVFVGLQLAYLFGGLDTMAAGGITYADYARRGFFELVAVTCLSGCLVVGLNADRLTEDTRVRRRGSRAGGPDRGRAGVGGPATRVSTRTPTAGPSCGSTSRRRSPGWRWASPRPSSCSSPIGCAGSPTR